MKKYIIILTIFAMFQVSISGIFSQQQKYEGKIVRKIDFVGLSVTDKDELLYEMKTSVGYPLNSSEMRKDIKTIFVKGKFEKIDVEIDEFQDGVKLRFTCKERPRVKEIVFKGNDEFVETDLEDSILLKEGEVFRKDFIQKSLKLLKDKYNAEGLFNASISFKIKPDKKLNYVNVEFIIDEGEEIKVEKISIFGASKIYSKELKSFMETQEEGIIRDGSFKKDIYEQDKAKIIGYYKEQGFLDAQIIEDKIEYEWKDPQKQEERVLFLLIKLQEGEKYYFDKYSVTVNGEKGKTLFTAEQLMRGFELKEKGEIFNYTKFQRDRQMISFKYASKGHIFARVVPKRTIEEREVVIDGKKEKRKFVSIAFDITEGSKAYVEQIIIKGNKKTKNKVIKRELVIKEGELFSSAKMQISREKVYNLGYFKQVNIDVRPGSREGYMNLIVDVEEQPSGTISLGGGYGTTSGFSIFADISENNFLGNGQRVGVKFEYGPQKSSITLSFAERWLFDVPLSFNTSVFYNLYNIETTSMFNTGANADYQKQSLGYSLGLSWRFWYYYVVGSTWSHAFKTYMNPSGNASDEIMIAAAEGMQQKRTQTFYVFRDSKDNYLNPTRGWRIGLSVGLTGGVIYGGDDHYVKFTPEFNYYISPFHLPFLKSHRCVFEFRFNGTFITKPLGSVNQDHTKNQWLESEDRLYLGGPETVRGWDYYDFNLPSSWRTNGLYHRILYGIEFRIPIHPQMLWLIGFFDAGALWGDKFWNSQLTGDSLDTVNDDLDSNDLKNIDDMFKTNWGSYFKYSYGFGFRIQIPMMPLRFWFGQKLIYDGGFRHVDRLTFQFQIGDMRY